MGGRRATSITRKISVALSAARAGWKRGCHTAQLADSSWYDRTLNPERPEMMGPLEAKSLNYYDQQDQSGSLGSLTHGILGVVNRAWCPWVQNKRAAERVLLSLYQQKKSRGTTKWLKVGCSNKVRIPCLKRWPAPRKPCNTTTSKNVHDDPVLPPRGPWLSTQVTVHWGRGNPDSEGVLDTASDRHEFSEPGRIVLVPLGEWET